MAEPAIAPTLDFERPVVDLERKIDELVRVQRRGHRAAPPRSRCSRPGRRELQQEIFAELTPWQKVQLSRHPARPYTLDYIERLVQDFVELHGDRRFAEDPAIVGGFGTVRGHAGARPRSPEGAQHQGEGAAQLRPAPARGLPQGPAADGAGGADAAAHHLPRSTPSGAYPGLDAEERGQAEAIAKNLEVMAGLPCRSCAPCIGEGGSGGALALGVAEPDPDARVRDLLGDLARGVRVDPVARRREEGRGGGGHEDDRDGPAAAGHRRRGDRRGARGRPPRPRPSRRETWATRSAATSPSCCSWGRRRCAPIAIASSGTWARTSSRAARRSERWPGRPSPPKRCA